MIVQERKESIKEKDLGQRKNINMSTNKILIKEFWDVYTKIWKQIITYKNYFFNFWANLSKHTKLYDVILSHCKFLHQRNRTRSSKEIWRRVNIKTTVRLQWQWLCLQCTSPPLLCCFLLKEGQRNYNRFYKRVDNSK